MHMLQRFLGSMILMTAMLVSSMLAQASVAPETHSQTFGHETGRVYTLVLPEELLGPATMTPEVLVLQNAKVGDVCIFELAGIGGRTDTLFRLVSALQKTACFTVMHVIGNVYSSHAYLAISGDLLIADKGTFLMFHDVQFGHGGADNTQDKVYRGEFQKLLHDMYHNQLHSEEFKFIFADSRNELYLTGEVMMERSLIAHGTWSGVSRTITNTSYSPEIHGFIMMISKVGGSILSASK